MAAHTTEDIKLASKIIFGRLTGELDPGNIRDANLFHRTDDENKLASRSYRFYILSDSDTHC